MTPPPILEWLLRVAGAGLIVLSLLHLPMARQLRWREEGALLSRMNEKVFHVHTFFVCLVLVIMGLPTLVDPAVLLERTALARWISLSWAVFWGCRLYCQWFVYPFDLWRGKRRETAAHWIFTGVWIALTGLYTAVAVWQFGGW